MRSFLPCTTRCARAPAACPAAQRLTAVWCRRRARGTRCAPAENPALSEALGKAVADVAAAAPADKPFTVAISGGSLPKLLAAGILAVEGVDYFHFN